MKHADPPADEAERLKTLERYAIVDTLPEQAFDDLTRLAAQLCGTPIALVSIVDADRQWFKSRVGLDAHETAREVAFCAHAILGRELFIVPDALVDERFHDNPLVTSGPQVRFYAGAPLIATDGQALGTLCVIDGRPRDLTPSQLAALAALARQVEAQLELRLRIGDLQRAQERALVAERAKSRFLTGLSHEMRTPLAAILGYAEELSSKEGPESAREQALASIRTNGQRLLGLVESALELAQLDAEPRPLPAERTPLMPMLRELVAGHAAAAQALGLSLDLVIDDKLPALSDCDLRVRRILGELLDNALKFTPQGTVTLRADSVASGDAISLSVVDTGIGIAPEHLQPIFQRFWQIDQGDTRRYGGAGLGLSVARELAIALGGRLSVHSVEGVGSTFTLEAPLLLGAAPALKTLPAAEPGAELTRPTRVLVVDDNPDLSALLGRILSKLGLEVQYASDGARAVELVFDRAAKATPFDLIMLDMQMPIMDGYAAARELRARGYTAPILALTADTLPEDRARSLAAGCDEHLPKPLYRPALMDALRRHVPGALPAS